MAKSKSKYHYIAYHLEAMNYAPKRYEKKLSELPSPISLEKADVGKLKSVITSLRGILTDYHKHIEYHQTKAFSHVPEEDREKGIVTFRKSENKSYETIFLDSDDDKKDDNLDSGFITADQIKD
jgi:hypothetical protein